MLNKKSGIKASDMTSLHSARSGPRKIEFDVITHNKEAKVPIESAPIKTPADFSQQSVAAKKRSTTPKPNPKQVTIESKTDNVSALELPKGCYDGAMNADLEKRV